MEGVGPSPEEGLTWAERRRAEIQSHVSVFLLGILFALNGTGMINAVFLTCCAEEMGASTFQFSVIPALWCLSTFPIFFVALWASRVRRVKALCLWTMAGASASGLAFCPALLLPHSMGTAKVWALLGVSLVGHFICNVFFAGWFVWLPHFVRRGRMGQFQSIRLLVLMAATMLSHAFGGFFLGWFPGMRGFSGLFAIGALAGFLALLPTARIPEPVRTPPASGSVRDAFRAVVRCRPLMRLFSYMILYNSVAMFAGVFPTVFMRKDLLIPYERLGLYTALASAGTLSATLAWGRLVDRFGGRPVMGGAGIGMVAVSFLWALNAPGHIAALPFAQFLSGVAQSAFSVSWLPLLYSLSPPALRGMAGSLSFLTWGAPGAVSPFIGGQVVERLSGAHFRLMGIDMGSIHLLFLIQCLGFALCLPMLRFIRCAPPQTEGAGLDRPESRVTGTG